jgi:hypothetical protein
VVEPMDVPADSRRSQVLKLLKGLALRRAANMWYQNVNLVSTPTASGYDNVIDIGAVTGLEHLLRMLLLPARYGFSQSDLVAHPMPQLGP